MSVALQRTQPVAVQRFCCQLFVHECLALASNVWRVIQANGAAHHLLDTRGCGRQGREDRGQRDTSPIAMHQA